MHYFTFYDDFGQHRISADQAQELLKVSKRTIQHYKTPEKRDAGRWEYLTAHATGRLIPEHWDLRIRGDHLHSGTGYSFAKWDLEKIAHVHSVKDNTIAGLRRDNAAMTAELEALQTEVDQLRQSTENNQPPPAPADIINLHKDRP